MLTHAGAGCLELSYLWDRSRVTRGREEQASHPKSWRSDSSRCIFIENRTAKYA